MKNNRQFWGIVFFGLLSAAPFIPVATNLVKLRTSVVLDEPITWAEGQPFKIELPDLRNGHYELRLESMVSDWQPLVKIAWGISNLAPLSSTEEIPLTRPVAKIEIKEPEAGKLNDLTIVFGNSNPTKNAIRIKLSKDRDVLLAESTREFSYVLAISLVLMAFLWKPVMMSPSEPQ
jgi:hypothetical protein